MVPLWPLPSPGSPAAGGRLFGAVPLDVGAAGILCPRQPITGHWPRLAPGMRALPAAPRASPPRGTGVAFLPVVDRPGLGLSWLESALDPQTGTGTTVGSDRWESCTSLKESHIKNGNEFVFLECVQHCSAPSLSPHEIGQHLQEGGGYFLNPQAWGSSLPRKPLPEPASCLCLSASLSPPGPGPLEPLCPSRDAPRLPSPGTRGSP